MVSSLTVLPCRELGRMRLLISGYHGRLWVFQAQPEE